MTSESDDSLFASSSDDDDDDDCDCDGDNKGDGGEEGGLDLPVEEKKETIV